MITIRNVVNPNCIDCHFTRCRAESVSVTRKRCPNCLERAGEEIDRSITEAGLERTFECRNCEFVWTVVF